jgi:formylglycine-generating enzyme required for sulfatase activity
MRKLLPKTPLLKTRILPIALLLLFCGGGPHAQNAKPPEGGTTSSLERQIAVRLAPTPPPAAPGEKRTALVIGNCAYPQAPLRNSINDAKAVTAALRECGFDVTLKTDCNHDAMEAAVAEFGGRIREGGGTALFYFAGHGVQVGGHNYLVPSGEEVKTEDEVEDRCLDMDKVLNKMGKASSRVNIVILDACRNNPFAGTRGSRGLAVVQATKGTLIAYSTAPGTVAADGSGEHSFYTESLLRHIRKPLSIADVFMNVRRDVMEVTKEAQVPWESTSLTHPFYFVYPAPGTPKEEEIPKPPEGGTTNSGRKPVAGPDLSGEGRKAGEVESVDLGGGMKMELVWIPAGSFQMGSPSSESGGDDDEGPVHTVELDGFWMGKYEVTQEQYQAVMGKNPSNFKGAKNPVVAVSSDDAADFCRKATAKVAQASSPASVGKTFRLPTEAEWEYACRAGSTTRFCFGDSDNGLDDYAWYSGNSGKQTHPLGEKKPNEWGLYDMHGNVWEWCGDWYAGKYGAGAAKNPQGSSSGVGRVLRGGGWNNDPVDCRSADRYWNMPTFMSSNFGFRVGCAGSSFR